MLVPQLGSFEKEVYVRLTRALYDDITEPLN